MQFNNVDQAMPEKADGDRLYAGASRVLEDCSPSALKVELLFVLAEMWGASDFGKAPELDGWLLSSNQNMTVNETTKGSLDLSGFFAHLGKLNFCAGDAPAALADVGLPPSDREFGAQKLGTSGTECLRNRNLIAKDSL